MFDAQCDLAALVYEKGETPDIILRNFAARLSAQGVRAIGVVQVGSNCVESKLSVLLLHSGEELSLMHEAGRCATGCRLDVNRLSEAERRVAAALQEGADLVIINRFGKQEREGKGFARLIEQALSSDIPVVIAVSSQRFADWIHFADGMSVRLACDKEALDAWWRGVSRHYPTAMDHVSYCEALK